MRMVDDVHGQLYILGKIHISVCGGVWMITQRSVLYSSCLNVTLGIADYTHDIM